MINNKKWKEDAIEQRLFEYTVHPVHQIIHQDQDVLNEVLKDKVKYLHLRWNLQHDAFFYSESYLFHREERLAALNDPAIVHFTNKLKPWFIGCTNPYRFEYTKYLKITPWSSYVYRMQAVEFKQKMFRFLRKFPKTLFSIRNSDIHKIITILGIKLKIKSKKLYYKQQLLEIKNHLDDTKKHQYWKLDQLEHLLQHICKQNETLKEKLIDITKDLSSKIERHRETQIDLNKEIVKQKSEIYTIFTEILTNLGNLTSTYLTNSETIRNSIIDLSSISAITIEMFLARTRYLGDINEILSVTGDIACSVWGPKVKNMLSNLEYLFGNAAHIEYLEHQDYAAELYILWGTQYYQGQLNIIKNAIYRDKPVIILEDGFLKSIETSACKDVYTQYHKGVSFVIECQGMYYDARKASLLERMLNDKSLVISEEQKQRAKTCINMIVKTHLTKYNHQPIFEPEIGRKSVKKILVVDQSYGDMSIAKGLASDNTFREMFKDAIAENPDADIVVKIHPDIIAGTGGYYTGLTSHDNIYTISDPINPISLIKYCDKVYVCTTQLGFEALMCGKEVHVYGMPFYAGWGLTTDRQKCPRRNNTRTLEELFILHT